MHHSPHISGSQMTHKLHEPAQLSWRLFGSSRALSSPAHPAPMPGYVGCAEQELKTTMSSVGQSAAPRHQHTRTLAAALGSHKKAEPGDSMLGAPLTPGSLRWEVGSINFSSFIKKSSHLQSPRGESSLNEGGGKLKKSSW